MKTFGVFFLLFLAELFAAPLLPLPATIAEIDGEKISSDKIRKAWTKALSALPDDVAPETISRLYRKLAEEALWQHEIAVMLAEQGIKPDRAAAEKYLNSLLYQVPEERAKALKLANLHAPDAPDMRLKAALHFYLEKTVPEAIEITAAEIENYYRNNQIRFKKPAQDQIGILETRDLEKAQMARSALLQGSSFDAAARLYGEGRPSKPDQEILQLVRKLRINEVAPLRKVDGHWQVIQLRSRQEASFFSLEEAAPLIRLELSARKEAYVLSRLLKERLSRKKIRYTPLGSK